jgi:hypothetical protein
MNPSIRHTIDDTEQIRPHMRLCHRMLSEALAAGFTAIELATVPGGTPTARALSEGSWKPFMAFPPAVYQQLVDHFKQMAGVASAQRAATGTILVRSNGRDASVELEARRNDEYIDELVLHFPARRDVKAAT